MKEEKINYGALGDEDIERGSSNEIQNSHNKIIKQIKIDFIVKVYGIVLSQLIITSFVCIIVMNSEDCSKFIENNKICLFISIFLSLIVMMTLICFKEIARRVPLNYILLFIFTISEAYLVSLGCVSTNNTKIVIMAAVMTCSIVLGLTIYAFITDTDYTNKGGILFCCLMCLILFAVFSIFINSRAIEVIISCLAVLLFSIYLIYDTQLLLNRYSSEDYIVAAMMIYIDIITIFLELLRLLKR